MSIQNYDKLQTLHGPGTDGDRYYKYRVCIPEASAGLWAISKFEVTQGIGLLRLMRDRRGTRPGWYTRLTHAKRGVIMSDTDAEIQDHLGLFQRCTGNVLIHGLGLGMAVQGVLASDRVQRVDVVELESDVISLVAPHFDDDRLHIHHGDAMTFKWPRGSWWNVVWHDIWDSICEDNIPSMSKLKRSFGRRCDWQGCWAEHLIRRLRNV